MTTVSNHMALQTARGRVKVTGRIAAFLGVVVITVLSLPATARADESSTQRPLPFPDQQSVTENDHLQRLRQLRAMMQQMISSKDQPSDQKSDGSPSNSSDPDNQAANARGLQQLGDALKSLADKLPPGMIPPSLDSIPKEQLREAVRNPAVQERMRQMLEQFNRDGLLPQENSGNSETGLPMPPMQKSPSETTPRGNRDSRDANDERPDSRTPSSRDRDTTPLQNRSNTGDGQPGEPSASASKPGTRPPADPGNLADQSADESNAIPPQSMKMLEQFLKGLTNQTNSDGPNSPDSPTSPDEAQTSGADQRRRQPANSAQMQPNPGTPSRGPLRRKDRSTTPMDPFQSSSPPPSNGPIARTSGQPDSPDEQTSSSGNPSKNAAGQKSEPAAAKESPSSAPVPDAESLTQMLKGLSDGARKNSAGDNPGLSISPEQQQRSLQALQDVLQELSAEQNSSDGAAGGLSNQLKSMAEGLAKNSSGLNSGQSKSPSSQDMRTFSEMLDQLKRSDAMKSLGQSVSPQDSGRPNGSNRAERRGSAQRQQSAPSDPSTNREADRSSAKAPINIVRELEQRGFGETLKKLVEKAKQETRESARQPSNGAASRTAAEGLSLNESTLKMLGGLREEMSELAKDPEIQREVLSSAAQSQTPPRNLTADSSSPPSAMMRLRSSFRELLGESASSTNANRPETSSPPNASAGTARADEFDFRAVGYMAAIIALLLAGVIGLKFWGHRIVQSHATQDIGPPILPSQVATKADVIRAFHQLVLNSTRPIQVWWTHRAAQKVLEATGPEQRAAVETLTETYEKARYLPQEAELTPEQIQSARAALQAVSRA